MTMMDVKLSEAMLLWNPGTNQVRVVDHPPKDKYFEYQCSALACYASFRMLNIKEQTLMLFIDAYTLVVRDGVNPKAVHNALLCIPEYRKCIPDDMQDPF